jgi:hypothetical protein
MKDFKEKFGQRDSSGDGYHFSNVRSGLIVSLLSVGTLMGALIAGPVADRIGRKWSISAWCIMLHIGLIVQMTAEHPKWYQSKSTDCVRDERHAISLDFLTPCSRRWKMDCWTWRGCSEFVSAYVSRRKCATTYSGFFD